MDQDANQDEVSELLDGDVLGEEPGDLGRPGVGDYPPERSLGAEDPSLYDEDDLETRAALRSELGGRRGDRPVVLVDPAPEGSLDHEPELIADDAVDPGDATRAAEEVAVHLVDADPVD
jgi:hypothetical protein